jgi:hypothetical protein
MTKEALKLALEALGWTDEWRPQGLKEEAITAIKEALANEALDKMAENARELGLDYEPEQTEHGWTPERIAGMARLKEAQDKKLAQPEQDVGITRYADISVGKIIHNSSPPQHPWVVLTDKEIEAIWKVALFADYGVGAELSNQPFVHYAKAIEAKLKDKNVQR